MIPDFATIVETQVISCKTVKKRGRRVVVDQWAKLKESSSETVEPLVEQTSKQLSDPLIALFWQWRRRAFDLRTRYPALKARSWMDGWISMITQCALQCTGPFTAEYPAHPDVEAQVAPAVASEEAVVPTFWVCSHCLALVPWWSLPIERSPPAGLWFICWADNRTSDTLLQSDKDGFAILYVSNSRGFIGSI